MNSKDPEGPPTSFKRQTLLYLAVAIHNIPEGLAVGLAFGLALKNPGDPGLMAVAVGLALGIGLQNFPEGAAISLPMKEEGSTKRRAFMYGMASGAVEPLFGLIGVVLAAVLTPIMPWALAFAAGAMIFVVVEELIPEARLGEHSHMGTFGFMAGFIIMMILDVAFG
jgi:ZIP family zinc transporter